MNFSIEFARKMYIGESIAEKNLDKIKIEIERKPLLSNFYFILPASNPENQLDIMHTRQLGQPFYDGHTFHVLGISSGYQEALELVQQITNDCLQTRGDVLLKEYITCLQ